MSRDWNQFEPIISGGSWAVFKQLSSLVQILFDIPRTRYLTVGKRFLAASSVLDGSKPVLDLFLIATVFIRLFGGDGCVTITP